MAAIIECKNVSKIYQEAQLQTRAVEKINLQIAAKDQVAIVGPSGSGKSTLLHLLGGLDLASSGQVTMKQKDYAKLSANVRSRLRNKELGFVYQFHHLLPEFTAVENVAMPLLIRGENARVAKSAATEILTKLGLKKRIMHKPAELSGGERQRAAIARALVAKPSCILADEPTGNLDSKNAKVIFELMLAMNQELGTSLIMVTHDETFASNMQRALIMQDGKLKES